MLTSVSLLLGVASSSSASSRGEYLLVVAGASRLGEVGVLLVRLLCTSSMAWSLFAVRAGDLCDTMVKVELSCWGVLVGCCVMGGPIVVSE